MNRSKHIILVITILILVSLFGFLAMTLNNDPKSLPSQLVGKEIPSFTGNALQAPNSVQNILTNKDFKGPALINVWATWCPSCREEHATLNVLKDQGITIYGINYKDDAVLAYNWLQELGNPYALNVVDQKGMIGINMGVYGAPETFFIDENNMIRYRYAGPILDQVWEKELKSIYTKIVNKETL